MNKFYFAWTPSFTVKDAKEFKRFDINLPFQLTSEDIAIKDITD